MKKGKLKKFMLMGLSVFLVIGLTSIFYLVTSDAKVRAQLKKESIQKMLVELERERKKVELEKENLSQLKSNLKSYEIELQRLNEDYLNNEKILKKQEDEFQKKLDAKTIDKQIIETYESIDPAQSAKLILDLYKQDKKLTTMLLRKISGRKAGKIFEEMIVLDRVISTLLAKQTLEAYNPDQIK